MLHEISKSFAQTSHGDIFVQEADGGGPVLALVSITSFGSALVDQALPLFAERGYRALALDLMGYGRSDKRREAWPITRFADSIEEALGALGVDRATLVTGHFSGLTGIELAARQCPIVERLVLDGTPYRTADERSDLIRKGAPAPVAWQEDGSHAVDHWKHFLHLIRLLNPDLVLPEAPDVRFRHAYMALLEVFAFGPNTMDALTGFAIEQKLPEIAVPTLLLTSGTDWNRKTQPLFAAAIPHATEHVFPGVHPMHDIMRPERAVEYVDVIDAFARD